MHVFIEARIVRVHVDDHDRTSVTNEIIHEDFRELAMTERDESEATLDVACIELCARLYTLLQAASEGSLVGPKRFHALSEDHERFVDVPGFAKALPRGMGVLCAL